MKEGNIRQLIISGLILGMLAGYWFYSGENKTIGYVFVGIFLTVIGYLLFKMLKK